MRNKLIPRVLLFLVSTCVLAFGESTTPCRYTEPAKGSTVDGVSTWTLKLIETSGEIEATVYVPESATSVPGILFDYSAIQTVDKRADLRRFAYGMARAGAASIVLDGDLDWKEVNDRNRRDPHVIACAGKWLLQHAKLDADRLVLAGPSSNEAGESSEPCNGTAACWRQSSWLNFGQSTPAEKINTDLMMDKEGQLRLANAVSRWVHLRSPRPEWF